MEFIQLEAFERVVRDGNFTRAADSLGVTQPAISTRISQLEAELGGKLFERQGRQLHLTPLGTTFLPYTERILAMMADSQKAVKDFHSGKIGQVKIAAPTPFVLGLLVDVLAEFRRQYPAVDVLIRERNKTTIFDMLHDNTITLGLVNAPVFDNSFRQIARFQDPIRAVVSPDHELAHYGGPLGMETIYQHTIFRVSMFPRMTAFIDDVAEHGRRGSGGAVIAVPMVMALRMAKKGQGITFLPESYVQQVLDEGDLVFIEIEDMPALKSTPVIIALKTRKLDIAHEEFVRIMMEQWRHLLV
ncbi:MAG: LysR family transcriptional regulator [Chloroflexi bacterium]|nr:LysR family transcriptional regulator [Chloroflexota bacterium]